MTHIQQLVLAFLIPLVICGCDQRPAAFVPKSTAPATKSVANADYASWRGYPVGTEIVRRKTIKNQHGTTVVSTKLKLVEMDDQRAKVDSQITVRRNEEVTENPVDSVVYAATHQIPETMSEEQIAAPAPDAQLLKEESIQVADRTVQAKVFAWKSVLESGPVEVTGWFSSEIPGRQIKLEFDYPDETVSSEEILSLKTPGTGEC